MPKIKYSVPKGAKDCNGKECTQDLDFEIDIPETKPSTQVIPTPKIDYGNTQQTQQVFQTPPPTPEPHNHDHSAPKKITHEDIKEIIPKGINIMECPGGNCGNELLKNPIQTKKYKTCPNGDCEANTVPKGAKACPYCTKAISEDEELDDGIDLTSEDDEE